MGEHVDEVLPGQTLAASADGWSAGNTAPVQLKKNGGAFGIWTCGGGQPDTRHQDWWDRAFTFPHVVSSDHQYLSQMAAEYYEARQDGAYLTCWGQLAACDGSAGGAMGAAAVFLDAEDGADEAHRAHACRVGGKASSFRAELVAMWLA
eukprot:265598-Rhodomonas_salina.1